MEIRLHGRGGQGGVTCAKILAALYARQAKFVQTFGDYAGERSGAPVRAYTRVDDEPITNRNKVYQPDHVIVLDRHLLGRDVLDGLRAGGILLINSAEDFGAFESELESFRVGLVDATEIARRHGIGTKSVVIVNTTIAGAFAKLDGIALDVLEATYAALGFANNFAAAKEAFESVRERAPIVRVGVEHARATPALRPQSRAAVEPLDAHFESLPTGLKTGTWSTQRPRYIEALAPCNAWCPAGNDVVGFVQALARSDDNEAARLLRKSTPLPGVCGRVCPAPCMEGCNRAEYDGAVDIRGLERWIADHAATTPLEHVHNDTPLRVAIVGGGPAGLSAAFTLSVAGHHPVIYERERELGGLLLTGIPNYRLPRNVLHREVAALLARGVEVKCGEVMTGERVRELERTYDAVILATGLQRIQTLDVPGVKLRGVEDGLHFLRHVNLHGALHIHGRVVVFGGGNSAIDCARAALRCGAEQVTVVYRRTRKEMPAIAEEIEAAEHEGVHFVMQRAPVEFVGKDHVRAVRVAEVELGEPDATGRRRPIVTDRCTELPCDVALLALGQSADIGLLPRGWEHRDGHVRRDGVSLRVFAAGDFATGDGTVAHAIGSGRVAATKVMRAFDLATNVFQRPAREDAVDSAEIRFDHFERRAPARPRFIHDERRTRGFDEVHQGLENATEATRCFSCGHCTRCDTCLVYCPEGIVRRSGDGYELDTTFCKGCGLCVHECPRKGMEMTTL